MSFRLTITGAGLSGQGTPSDPLISAFGSLPLSAEGGSNIKLIISSALTPDGARLSTLGGLISADGGNAISIGADGGLFATAGGNTTAQGLWGSRPAASSAGNLYFATDGFVLSRDQGSGNGYSQWGPVFKFVPPVLTDFTAVNQGGATATDTGGAVVITTPTSTGDNLRIWKKAAPITPYTIDIAFLYSLPLVDFNTVGFVWRNSGSGRLVTAHRGTTSSGSGIGSSRWNGPTSFDSSIFNISYPQWPLVWIRVTDDGIDRKVYISSDGQTWVLLNSHGHTDWITPDEVGFFLNVNQTIAGGTMTLLHWQQS